MNKKYLQLPRFQTHKLKSQAIPMVEIYINENIADFKDGEEIAIEYIGLNGEQMYSTAVVQISEGVAKLRVSIEESETLKIVESENTPEDKSVLWLAGSTNEEITAGQTSNLREEINSLKKVIADLQDIVFKHDYALNNTLAGGDIIANATKFDLENQYKPEMPEGATDNTDYAEDDTTVTSFEIMVANSPLSDFSGVDASLYKGQAYPLKLKLYNDALELVKETDDITIRISCIPSTVATIDENRVLLASTSGDVEVAATVISNENTVSKVYNVHFDYSEEPDYKIYEEPNVHHWLVKKADTLKILTDNVNYLLIGEMCWVVSENALYIKEKAANGTIQLFKLNGSGGSITPDTGTTPDTGSTAITSETTFKVENDILDITTDENGVYVDENGILNINVGEVSGEILLLNDHTVTGGTSEESTVVVTPDGEMSISGQASVENSILLLNSTVTPNGTLEITT